jgi:hypothetical protein
MESPARAWSLLSFARRREAKAFLSTMTQRVHLKASRFDATDWPSRPQQRQAIAVDP